AAAAHGHRPAQTHVPTAYTRHDAQVSVQSGESVHGHFGDTVSGPSHFEHTAAAIIAQPGVG
ncbi:MAG TPA: hypothetical protein VGG18_07255, partial [Granulicella sp.]